MEGTVSDWQQPGSVPVEVLTEFAHYIRFVSRDPAKNRNRFYLLRLAANPRWACSARVHLGRIGTTGRSRIMCYAEHRKVQDTIARIIQRRLQSGYQVTEWR